MQIVFFVITLFLCSCQSDLFSGLKIKEQPTILSINPSDGALINNLDEIRVSVSKSIDPTSVDEYSFIITESKDILELDSDDILSAIEDHEVQSIEGVYDFSEDYQNIVWKPNNNLSGLVSYTVILTSHIQTEDHLPLSQTPNQGSSFFMSQFTLEGSVSGENQSDNFSVESNVPEVFLINEILYDAIGTETDGSLFVELYGTALANIEGYVVRFINGADGKKTDEIVFDAGTTLPDDGILVIADAKTGIEDETFVVNADIISNFDPQNGPDSVQLISSTGVLIDALGYGEGMVSTDEEGNNLYEEAPAGDAEAGSSLSRIDMKDTNNNSHDFVVNTVPSPGELNVTSDLNSELNELVESTEVESTEDVIEENEEQKVAEEEMYESTKSEDIHFTEVVTDPQQDWNDSVGGNGIQFDSIPGNGTVGSTDEWIEIKNGRDEVVDLADWKLEMNDGTDETEYFSSTSAILNFSLDGDTNNFQPDEYLVIGNPSGDLKNTATLRLLDMENQLIDEIFVDDANATSVDDESYQLLENLTWELNGATISF